MEEKVDSKPNDDLIHNKEKVSTSIDPAALKADPRPIVEVPKGHEQPKCQLQIMCEHGVGFQTRTPLSADQIIAEIETNGGVGRIGFALIPTQPKPDQVAELLRVNRQKIIGYLITVLGEGGNSRVPLIHSPSDEAVMKLGTKR